MYTPAEYIYKHIVSLFLANFLPGSLLPRNERAKVRDNQDKNLTYE